MRSRTGSRRRTRQPPSTTASPASAKTDTTGVAATAAVAAGSTATFTVAREHRPQHEEPARLQVVVLEDQAGRRRPRPVVLVHALGRPQPLRLPHPLPRHPHHDGEQQRPTNRASTISGVCGNATTVATSTTRSRARTAGT